MSGTDPGNQSSAQIERDVERTRANVAGTLDELRDRLNPSQLVDGVMDQARDYIRGSGGTEFAQNLGQAVRDNPLPVALIGAGIAWLLLSGGKGGSSTASTHAGTGQRLLTGPTHGDDTSSGGSVTETATRLAGTARARVSGVMDAAGDTVGQAAGTVGEAASNVAGVVTGAASRVAEAGSDLASRAVEGVGTAARSVASLGGSVAGGMGDGLSSAGDRASAVASDGLRSLDRLADAQPLLFGALGLAVGAALGAILPRTRAEDEMMGEARDALAGQVEQTVRGGMAEAQTLAGESLGQAGAAFSEGYAAAKEGVTSGNPSKVADALKGAMASVTEAAKDALHGAAERAKEGVAATGDGKPPR